jgi:hypothetical protein
MMSTGDRHRLVVVAGLAFAAIGLRFGQLGAQPWPDRGERIAHRRLCSTALAIVPLRDHMPHQPQLFNEGLYPQSRMHWVLHDVGSTLAIDEETRREISSAVTQLARCRDVELTKASLRFVIPRDGHVASVVLSGAAGSTDFRSCVTDAVADWTFPMLPVDVEVSSEFTRCDAS